MKLRTLTALILALSTALLEELAYQAMGAGCEAPQTPQAMEID